MNTRCIVALAFAVGLTAPLAVDAQQPVEKIYRIGLLHPGRCLAPDPNNPLTKALESAGYRQGRNVAFECGEAKGDPTKFPRLATELVDRKVDVIFALSTAAAKAARDATSRVPIVFAVADAVAEGLVPSLARPGGNLTGISTLGREVWGKTLELLKQVVPGLHRVAVLVDPALDPLHRRWAQEAGTAAGVEPRFLIISGPDDYERAFQEASRWGAGAVALGPTVDNYVFRSRIASFAMASGCRRWDSASSSRPEG